MNRIKLIWKHTADKLRTIFCAVFRHSVITSQYFGYHSCGRCDAQLGDSLAGAYSAECNLTCGCKHCQECYSRLGFLDKFLVPKPEWLGFTPEDWRAKITRERNTAMKLMRQEIDRMNAQRAQV